ncbi:MAG: hypothetical protein S4CHLAM7_12060 [Chlamydiae bacterium]|nr:hypothetical protein [Chlamydiota bacterium]
MPTLETLKEQIDYLINLMEELSDQSTLADKVKLLESEYLVEDFLASDHLIESYYPNLSLLEKLIVCSIIVIGQAPIVFQIPKHLTDTQTHFKKLIDQLLLIDRFYREIGGVIGYHYQMVHLLFEKGSKNYEKRIFHRAVGTDIQEDTKGAEQAVLEGIKNLPFMGELYPIGGSGDRLDLKDDKTGLPLPTAKLMFLGRSLLTGLVRDLQAREFLYYKLYQKQLITPIAMMTSEAKNNHQFIHKICEDNIWYHRPKNTFFPFMQPQAPVLTQEGNWSLKAPLQLYLKPSGHGVIWKITQEKGVLRWFKNLQRKKILIRQINNPIAGIDNGLLALIGIGCSQNKAFGFASCHRLIGSAEGVNILTESHENDTYQYAISNIEYTDFEKNHIQDEPIEPSSLYSIHPSNTNILFADIHQIEHAIEKCLIPGMLINMKNDVPFLDASGKLIPEKGGRLESTMQNIADYLTDEFPDPITEEDSHKLKTFLTYNERAKTISVTKKTYKAGESINETPEGSYFTLIQNNLTLLKENCNFKVPSADEPDTFVEKGPKLHFIYHPALGPLYSIIAQKLRHGSLAENSELQLEITELDLENLELDGSLVVHSPCPLGHLDENNLLHFSNLAPRCTLKNIKVYNAGIDRSKKSNFWKNQIERKESFELHLSENSEFLAEDIIFKGSFHIEVPANTKVTAYQEGDSVRFQSSPLTNPSWSWKYSLSKSNQIHLEKK